MESKTLYVFTDGAARRNGYSNCRASYGVFATDGAGEPYTESGRIIARDIPGQVYRESNNRGELFGIIAGLKCIAQWPRPIVAARIISDSQISISAIFGGTFRKWESAGTLDRHMNTDLLREAVELAEGLAIPVTSILVRSHQKKPTHCPKLSFLWDGNDAADKLASAVLQIE